MDLRQYLFDKRIKIAEFSRMLDYSRNHLNQVVLGNMPITEKLARAIERVTNGDLKKEDLIKEGENGVD